MSSRARTLLVAAPLIACSGTGCRENVYLGNPVERDDASLIDDAPTVEPDAPPAPIRGYLHAQGRLISDEAGAVVRLKGVNWSGMETGARVPDGLHRRKLDSLV